MCHRWLSEMAPYHWSQGKHSRHLVQQKRHFHFWLLTIHLIYSNVKFFSPDFCHLKSALTLPLIAEIQQKPLWDHNKGHFRHRNREKNNEIKNIYLGVTELKPWSSSPAFCHRVEPVLETFQEDTLCRHYVGKEMHYCAIGVSVPIWKPVAWRYKSTYGDACVHKGRFSTLVSAVSPLFLGQCFGLCVLHVWRLTNDTTAYISTNVARYKSKITTRCRKIRIT